MTAVGDDGCVLGASGQGLRLPFNDLPIACTVKDVVNMALITCVQVRSPHPDSALSFRLFLNCFSCPPLQNVGPFKLHLILASHAPRPFVPKGLVDVELLSTTFFPRVSISHVEQFWGTPLTTKSPTFARPAYYAIQSLDSYTRAVLTGSRSQGQVSTRSSWACLVIPIAA